MEAAVPTYERERPGKTTRLSASADLGGRLVRRERIREDLNGRYEAKDEDDQPKGSRGRERWVRSVLMDGETTGACWEMQCGETSGDAGSNESWTVSGREAE